MLKKCVLIMVLICSVFSIAGCSSNANDYLRIHIRANSNSNIDQNIKYLIKDVVVEYITPIMQDCDNKSDVIDKINEYNDNIKELIDKILQENGFNYTCNININNEFFPTRTYDDLTLEADFYDALIINLGTGEGDNWWCVMYPNLCFNEPDNVVYKSKIVEIIEKIKR